MLGNRSSARAGFLSSVFFAGFRLSIRLLQPQLQLSAQHLRVAANSRTWFQFALIKRSLETGNGDFESLQQQRKVGLRLTLLRIGACATGRLEVAATTSQSRPTATGSADEGRLRVFVGATLAWPWRTSPQSRLRQGRCFNRRLNLTRAPAHVVSHRHLIIRASAPRQRKPPQSIPPRIPAM